MAAFAFSARADACGFVARLSSFRSVQAEAAEVEIVRRARPTRMVLFMLNSRRVGLNRLGEISFPGGCCFSAVPISVTDSFRV
jgi:hypothetical protein